MGLDHTVVFARYGERFKRMRKLINQPFNPRNSMSFQAVQRRETHTLLYNILTSPDMYESHIER